LKARRKYLK